METKNIFTLAVHAGERQAQPDFTPVTTPIYNSVGYLYEDADDLDAVFAGTREGYVYARYGNPTTRALEVALAALEQGEAAIAFSSGMAAIHAALVAVGIKPGTRIVAAQDLYGATYNLLARFLAGMGVHTRFLDMTDLDAVRQALSEEDPSIVLFEGVSNPLLRVVDVPAVTDLAHAQGAQVIVDNTFTTPYLFKPLAAGVDYVVHSTTKYLAGHGDVLGGAIIASQERIEALRLINRQLGANLGPNEAYLTMRGLKTFPLRMRQHCANAERVAAWLQSHPMVSKVNYPGLASHPQHEVAGRLFGPRGYGGMISFEIRSADQAKVFRFFEALKLCLPATTLGDVYSLVLYPAHSSHRAMTPEERRIVGIGPGLVRLSVGIEEADDIIQDLNQALHAAVA